MGRKNVDPKVSKSRIGVNRKIQGGVPLSAPGQNSRNEKNIQAFLDWRSLFMSIGKINLHKMHQGDRSMRN